MDQYQRVESNDWGSRVPPTQFINGGTGSGVTNGKSVKTDKLSLQALDSEWHPFTTHLLRGRTEIDSRVRRSTLQPGGFDVLDARGTFDRNEVKRELKRLSGDELENRLGITFNKIDDVLNRVRAEKDGKISYKDFLKEVQRYRLSSEQESRFKQIVRIFAFTEEFSCTPPTLFMIFITLLELALFVYTSYNLPQDYGVTIGLSSPVPYCSRLIYNPARRWEAWRFMSYMFVHIGIQHFVFNMIMQIFVGIPLEMSQPGWVGSLRVMLVYLAGVAAASLGTSITDPDNYIAGASGGVYSLISAHLATLMINWQEDSAIKIQKVIHKPITRIIRLVFISLLTVHDVGFAIYVRLYDPENRTGFTGHLCGAIAGILVGLVCLENRRVRDWECFVQVLSILFFLGLMVFAIVWNFFADQWYDADYFPRPDHDLYEYGDCKNYGYI